MKDRFVVLDIFRGIFASTVVLYHLSPFSNTIIINNTFIKNCDLFVDFFFVLSGFVISYNNQIISSKDNLSLFIKKRFFRLYPLHFIVLIAFLAIELSKEFASKYIHVNELINKDNNVFTFIYSLFLLNSIKLPGAHDVSWNTASWSISAEAISYLLFGLIMLFTSNSRIKELKMVVMGALVFLAVFGLYVFNGNFSIIYHENFGFLRGILGFFTGVIGAYTYINIVKINRYFTHVSFNIFEIFTSAFVIFTIHEGESIKKIGIIYDIIFLVVILVFAFEKGIISKSLKNISILQTLGKYSYSIYMIHTLGISIFNIIFIRILKFSPEDYAYLFILNYIVIYIASSWTYKNIEMRFNYRKQY